MMTKPQKAFILLPLLFLLSIAIPLLIAKISVATPIVQTQPHNLIKQGEQFYNLGQFTEAVPIWQQAAETFASQGNYLNQAMALSNLSLTYQQLGNWEQATETINESLNILENLEKTAEQQRILAQTLDIQGQLQQKTGQSQAALNTWQRSGQLYTILNDQDSETITQINQAQAMQDLGLYPRACKTLLTAIGLNTENCSLTESEMAAIKPEFPQDNPNKIQIAKARALRSLGNVLRVTGNLQQSEQVLQISLEIAQNWVLPQEESKTLLNLGNTQRSLSIRAQEIRETQETDTYREKALNSYQQAAMLSPSSLLKIQSKVNQLELLISSTNI